VPEPSVEPAILAARAQALALSLGFDRAGIASLGAPTPEAESLRAWIASGRHGEMDWLARRVDERIDPRLRFAWARTAIVVGIVYDTPAGRSAGETDARPAPPAAGRVARYAGGDDYHDVLLAPLRALAVALEPLAGRPVQTRAYVDAGAFNGFED
jgi:epoxyqueuosine reductase